MFSRWRQPPPEPPFYKKRPVATAAVILSIIGMFVLGPIGAIYKGMTEELKKKADYETVILILKQQEKKDDRQWKEIERNREQSQKAPLPRKSVRITGPAAVMTKKIDPQRTKLVLTPEQFEKYLKMESSIQVKYKRYLESRGYDIGGLP